MNVGSHCADGLPRLVLDFISEPCAKTYGAQNPEFVFFEASMRVADGTNQFCFDIGLAVDVIDHFFGGWVVKQSIDSEITPQNVLLRICEHDAGRTPPIDIGLIGSK